MIMENGKFKEQDAALDLKKQQDRVRAKFEHLKNTPARYFQAEYVKAQAEEICSYLRFLQLTPFSGWYSEMYQLVSSGPFMSKYYLTFNNSEGIEPDYTKIESLILPEPKPEDYPRSSLGAEFI